MASHKKLFMTLNYISSCDVFMAVEITNLSRLQFLEQDFAKYVLMMTSETLNVYSLNLDRFQQKLLKDFRILLEIEVD